MSFGFVGERVGRGAGSLLGFPFPVFTVYVTATEDPEEGTARDPFNRWANRGPEVKEELLGATVG